MLRGHEALAKLVVSKGNWRTAVQRYLNNYSVLGWELKCVQKFGLERQVLKELPKAPIMRRLRQSAGYVTDMRYYGSKTRGLFWRLSKTCKTFCWKVPCCFCRSSLLSSASVYIYVFWKSDSILTYGNTSGGPVISESKWQGWYYGSLLGGMAVH